MKLYDAEGRAIPSADAADEYRAARAVGGVRVGATRLFFRAGLRVYAVEWTRIARCYRQVMRVPMKLCCGSGTLDVEYLVIDGASGTLARVQLPGSRAARALMALIEAAAPDVDRTPPGREREAEVSP